VTSRGGRRRALVAVLALAGLAACASRSAETYDLIVRGGLVLDGAGNPPRRADVGVRAGRIVAIRPLERATATTEIDATGRVVAPGFIDMHSHADLILLGAREVQERLLEAKIRQGVTTLVVGNCGLGAAPATEAAAEILAGVNGWMTPEGVEAGAGGIGDYLDRLEAGGTAVNVATLVPHGPVRISVMGLAAGEPDEAQLHEMALVVRRSLDQGAFGLSCGLIYPPGMYSRTRELIVLAREVAASGGLFTAHVRGSSETLIPATEELIEVARASGAHVHHSHFEAVGRRFWDRIPEALALEDQARGARLKISHDVFPYTRAATMMSAIFPPWSLEGGVDALLERLADPRQRQRIADDIGHKVPDWPPWGEDGWPHNLVEAVGWDGILVASVAPGGPTDWIGRSLADIAAERSTTPFDAVVELMQSQHGRVGQFVTQISGAEGEDDALLSILRHPAAAVISDAEDYGRGAPHPAHAGAFVRALRLARERSLMPLEEIVRRMTDYPASLLGLTDRGHLAPGMAADLVVFDPETVADRADWEQPRRPAEGVDWVVINGHVVVGEGAYRGGLPGTVLRAPRR